MKNKINNIFIFLFTIFVVLTVTLIQSTENVKADNSCLMCDATNSANKSEKQFMEKIKIIKSVFSNQIDDIVLATTVLHNGGSIATLDSQYDKEFNKNDYKKNWQNLKTDSGNISADNAYNQMTQEQLDHGKVDILTAATILMLDSSGWTGYYNEDKYKTFLAGDKLVGNGFDEDVNPIGSVFNTIFCTAGAVVDSQTTPIEIGFNILSGQNLGESYTGKVQRFQTMSSICTNGFIGGIYQAVQDIVDENQKKAKKESIANDIIYQANLYKRISGQNSIDSCLNGNTQATVFMNMSPEEYIKIMGPIAQADYSRSNIFASVTLAQSIIESGWGKSGLTQQANNLFGIKCNGWPTCINMATSEYGSGGYYTITDGFRKYDSVEASVEDHSNFLRDNSRYEAVFSATTNQNQIAAIHAAGYATSPTYTSTVMSAINEYDLGKWDVKINTTSTSSSCSPTGADWAIRTVTPTATDPAFNYVNSNRGQCVWYAQGRAIEIVEELGSRGKLSASEVDKLRGLLLRAYGNGGEIYDNAKSVFNSSNNVREPKSGSYIVWKKAAHYGHVAVIEDVNTSAGTITITEGWSLWGDSCPNSWGCVYFLSSTMSLENFYNSYGPYGFGGYVFSGYVYFLEPLS